MHWNLEDKTVWRDEQSTRYFLVADDAELPAGEFAIRTVTGKHRKTDEEALRALEISEEEATVWLKQQFGNFLDGLRGAAEGFIAKINLATEKLRSSSNSQEKPKPQA
jgi:hypothetical protein